MTLFAVLFGILLALIPFIFYAYVMSKIFSKAQQPGWGILIPIYNTILMLRIVGKPWWWIFLLFLFPINIIFIIILTHQLSLSFGKGSGFTLGLIFLGFIFLPILAFSDAQYIGPGGNSEIRTETY